MKKIRLGGACRYLSRYGGELECIDKQLFAKRRHITGDLIVILERFTPKETQVFLKNCDGKRIAKITEGLPEFAGHFFPQTGEFLREIPY